jgi:multiple sugar transport system substrate-binding protein
VDETRLRGLHVHFWYSGPLSTQKAMDELVDAFNAGNPQGLWVETTYFGSFEDLGGQVQAAAVDQHPDLALDYLALAGGWPTAADAPVDLQPYLDDPIWGLSAAERADYPQGMIPDGGQAVSGLPAYRREAVLFYNQSWASELGFSQAPKTPSEFHDQACAAAKANQKERAPEKTGTGGWIASNDAAAVLSWTRAFGGSLPPGAGKTFSFNTDATSQAFTFLKGMFDQGCIWVARNPDPSGYLTGRQALFYSGSSDDIWAQAVAFSAKKSTDRWTVLPYPGQDGSEIVYSEGPDFLILPGAPERELAAWLFVRWVSSAENQVHIATASGVLPVSLSSKAGLATAIQEHPQWGAALGLQARMQAMPEQPAWVLVRPILQDAAGQLYTVNTKPAQIGKILDMLDQTIQEVVSHTP